MKDSKNLMLLMVCLALLFTWIYHVYDKSMYTRHQFQVLVKDTLATHEAVKDSLSHLFAQKSVELDTSRVMEDSLKGTLDSTMLKIYGLRLQIGQILHNKNSTQNDLKKARDLIGEYQEKIEDMKSQNTDLDSERSHLNAILGQLNDQMRSLKDNNQKISQENASLTQTINEASTFIASEFCLTAVSGKAGKKDVESNSSKKADKFVFSFSLQNNIARSAGYDLYVVVTQPDNKVLLDDVWGAGADYFTSKTEGTKAYTAKIHFDYTRGEKKKILYTVQPDNLEPGTYVFQVYQNGVALGETTRVLN